MRDKCVTKCYRALKLACWVGEGKYWQGGLTQTQAMNLVEAALNHEEVDARWGEGTRHGAPLNEIEVTFAERGSTAWAKRDRIGRIHLPKDAMSPLVVLHEVAHLLPVTRKEPIHGPGFVAVHLMLTELLRPELFPALLSANHALDVPYNVARIPKPVRPTGWVPLSSAFGVREAAHYWGAVLASGNLSEDEEIAVKDFLRRFSRQRDKVAAPMVLPQLPPTVTVKTEALLACNSDADIAALLVGSLREALIPKEFVRPAPPPKGKK